MRILPRTTKGTWLLAAAVWVGGCACVWWLVPMQPRSTWRLPEAGRPVGFLPGGEVLITSGGHTAFSVIHRIPDEYSGPFRLWDIATGRQIKSYLSARDTYRKCQVSFTGRWLALAEWRRPVRLFDLEDGSFTTALGDSQDGPTNSFFGPDDQWFGAWGGGRWRRFSVPKLEPLGDITEKAMPFNGLAPDGRALANADPVDRSILRVWDTVTEQPVGAVRLPDDWLQVYLLLSAGGNVAHALTMTDVQGWELFCWDVSTSRQMVHEAGRWRTALAPNGRTLVGLRPLDSFGVGVSELVAWDLPAGTKRIIRRFSAPERYDDSLDAFMSPDGRTAVVKTRRDDRFLAVRAIVELIGRSWPLSSRELAGAELFAIDTGQSLGFVPGEEFVWSQDGTRLAAIDPYDDHILVVWDIPPRKPLTWIAIAAAVLALPIAGLAWGRSRRLHREMA
jgi:WD40 repeat protein